MIKKTLTIVISIFISSCTFKAHEIHDINRAIDVLSNAEILCEAKQKTVPAPNLSTLKQMNNISNDVLLPYIKYRWYINYQSCLIENGAPPTGYFVAIAHNKEKPVLITNIAKKILQITTNSHLVADIDVFNRLSSKEKERLHNISYLQHSFDLLTVSDALAKYRIINNSVSTKK